MSRAAPEKLLQAADLVDRLVTIFGAERTIDIISGPNSARIRIDREAATMNWLGIKVSCTAGPFNLLRAWANKARAAATMDDRK